MTEGSVDASSQYIVNSVTYLVGYFPFCKYLLMSYLFIFPKDESEGKWKHQPKTENDMVMEPRNRSLPVFTWRCQDANTIAM